MLSVEGPLSTAIYFAYINPHSIRLFGSFAVCNRKTILFPIILNVFVDSINHMVYACGIRRCGKCELMMN